MLCKSAALLAGVLISGVSALDGRRRSSVIEDDHGIDWFPCSGLNAKYSHGDELNISCGYYDVPLDWADHSVGTASLAVAIYPATKERRGTMYINAGGPGYSGIEFLLQYGPNHIRKAIGEHYDFVAWDPRGVGHTTPGPPSCFHTAEDWEAYFNGTLEETGLDIKGNLTDDDQLYKFYSHVPEMERKYRGLGKRCAEAESSKTLAYLGSAAAARDMVALADYLDPGIQELNSWGFSYGSMVGFIFVNMFPDRVGHVVLDGCMHPLLYATRPITEYYLNSLESSEETFGGFATGCAMAGKNGCKLVQSDSDTAADVALRIRGMLDLAHDLFESGADLTGTYTSAQAREHLYNAMATPLLWSQLAEEMHAYGKDLTAIAANTTCSRALSMKQSDADSDIGPPTYEYVAILCGDSVDAGNMSMRGGFEAIARAVKYVSPLFGPQWHIGVHMCFAWPARAVERYTGPWDSKLKNRILIIGNSVDPETPCGNAKLMADLLGHSAALVRQDGFGHVSVAERSSCITNIISRYFEDGTLAEGSDATTTCPIDDDVVLFPNSTVA